MEKKPQEEAKKLQSKEISLKRKGKTVKTVKIEEKTSKKTETIEEEKEKYNAEERIRERVGEDLAKSICQLKGIKYNS